MVVVAGGGSSSNETTGFWGTEVSLQSESKGEWCHTWSEVVYDGMAVYNRFLILDSCGVSGESEWVTYMTRSVHAGTRLGLLKRVVKKCYR